MRIAGFVGSNKDFKLYLQARREWLQKKESLSQMTQQTKQTITL